MMPFSTSFQEGLEGDRVRDRVQLCQSAPEIVHLRKNLQDSASKMTNVDIVKYLYVITGNS